MIIKFYPQPDGCMGVKIANGLRNEQWGAVLRRSATTDGFSHPLESLIEGKPLSINKGHDPWHGVNPEPLFRPQNTGPDI